MTGDRLFGLPGADELYRDPASVYEACIDPWVDDPDRLNEWTIEEWTAHPPRHHMPTVDHVLEQIGEWIADNGEWGEYVESWDVPLGDPDVKAATDALFDLIASKVKGRMAADHVASHKVTFDDAGEPLYDGAPLYGART